MKKLLYTVSLLAVACHSDIFPNDLLYQRWQLVQTRQGNGAWDTNKSTALFDVEYLPDGTLVYHLDGKVTSSCCQFSRFDRQQNELTFNNVTSCALALCAAPASNKATITQLTADLLELTSEQTVSQYKSVK